MTDRTSSREPVALLLAGLGIDVSGEGFSDDAASGDVAVDGGGADASAGASAAAAPFVSPSAHLRDLDARLEALLMVADGPLQLPVLAAALDRPIAVARQAVERIRADYDGESGGPRRGYALREVATGWRLMVRAEHDALVRDFLRVDTATRLSQAALETLAVVAYRQPVTRGQVAAIRAVSVDAVMRTLVSRGLIETVGQVPETGAALYGTTPDMLVALGIGSLGELPPIAPLLADVHEVTADAY